MPSQNADQSPKRACLGKIVAAHGVKGLVKILPFGDDPALLAGNLYTSESGADTLSVTLKNPIGRYILAEIEGVQDRTHAENTRGTELFVEKKILPDLKDEDSFYISDLAGLKVLNKNEEEIGKVLAAQNYGAGDLLEIRLLSGEELLLPFTKETVPQVSIENGHIGIDNYQMYLEE